MAGTGGFFEYGITKNWSVVYKNVIGTTKDLTFRPITSLPRPLSQQGAKNDALTIYIDPVNGNDANTGFTLALAKKTWDSAILAHIANPLRSTIHIDTTSLSIRDFSLTAGLGGTAVNFPETIDNVQSAAGSITTITADGSYQTSGAVIKVHFFNGVYLKNLNQIGGAFIAGVLGTNKSLNFRWCQIDMAAAPIYGSLGLFNCYCRNNPLWNVGTIPFFTVNATAGNAVNLTAFENIFEIIN